MLMEALLSAIGVKFVPNTSGANGIRTLPVLGGAVPVLHNPVNPVCSSSHRRDSVAPCDHFPAPNNSSRSSGVSSW